jgi:hypothetical protein
VFKTLLVLVVLALVGAYLYPRRHEATDTACAALKHRLTTLMQAEWPRATALPGAANFDPALAALRDRLPFLSPEEACVAGYWITLLQPDFSRLAQFLPSLAPPIKP